MNARTLARSATTALVAATTCLSLTAAAAAATTDVRPQDLDRGADAAVPHVEGKDIVVDGERTRVRGQWFQLLGTRPDGRYVVLVQRGDGVSVRAVTPGGSARKILGDADRVSVILSGDGTTLVTSLFKNRPHRHTLLRAYDSTTGVLLGQRKRAGALTALDADPTTVVYSGENGPVVSWDLATGTGTRVSRRLGYRADLSHDRLAVFTGDPYDGGCSVVSTLSDPSTALWRSCDEAVIAFSPDGDHVLTTFLLADGLGPTEVWVRTVEGEQTGAYTVDGFFEQMLFEDEDTVLLDAHTSEASGLARCTDGTCELAADLGPGETWLRH